MYPCLLMNEVIFLKAVSSFLAFCPGKSRKLFHAQMVFLGCDFLGCDFVIYFQNHLLK